MRLRCSPGDLLIFPGWLRHAVPEFTGAGLGISLSWNLGYQVEYVTYAGSPCAGRLREELASRIQAGAALHVAVMGDRVAGVVETGTRDVPADGKVRRVPAGRAGVIEWICTAAQHRRHGIGGTLISAAVEQLGRQGADYAYVFHGANNELSSHRLWRRSGFHPGWATWEMALAPAG